MAFMANDDKSAAEQPATSVAPDGEQETKIHRIRWRSGLMILILGAIAEAFVLGVYDDDTRKIYNTLKFVFPVVAGSFIIWWFAFSGFSWRIRCAGALIVVLMVVGFSLRYRIDGFSGAMWPQVSLRSDPTPEQQAAQFFKQSVRKQPRTASGKAPEDGAAEPATPEPVDVAVDDWPQFRGPRGDGIVRDVSIRTDWADNPPKARWRHVVGPAWSSFVIADGLLFTQEQRGANEAVVCYDPKTGKQIWQHLDKARYDTVMGGIGPRATPTLFDSRLYALGATGILNCLDARTGKVYWTTNILVDAGTPDEPARNLDWGMSGSPLVYDDVVVVNPGGEDGRSIIVYDRLTGKQRWARGDQRASYAGVQRVTLGGTQQLLIYDAAGVGGYDPNDGKPLWRFPWSNSDRINVALPIVRDDSLVFISSGYGTGSALLEVAAGAAGGWNVEPRWKYPGRFKLKFNDGIYKDGFVYGLDEGILACLELATGKLAWKRGRYGHGQLLLIDDANLLLVQAEDGKVLLVPASPEKPTEVAGFKALGDKTWNHPVLHRGFLYVRNFEEAACYDLRPAKVQRGSEGE